MGGDQPADLFAAAVTSGALDLPLPGGGRTRERWAALRALGEQDLVLARLAEGHTDALAILAELGGHPPVPPNSRWGVWAAVPGSLTAVEEAGGWRLTGERPWCSGAVVCTHALVTASAPDGIRLFAVANPNDPVDGTWPAVGMAASDSRTVRFTSTPAEAVGKPGDYVGRAGFWHGAIGVAACWHGGAVGVARALLDSDRTASDPHAAAHLGGVDAALHGAGVALDAAAVVIDAEPGGDARWLAGRTRAIVERAASEVLERVGRALGAGPLCLDATHARRVADLTVYLRQSHGERDLAVLGEQVAQSGDPRW
ncbi:acyl-CoA dehydrogenase family protein [Asanoa sp. NPDC049573]|uniref:acyl-CoA dehydrogenase family protein n=1 Tax=Asanoa sp. NPDC049573 TaxID=3155396 RepID=UPI003441293C